MTRFLLVVLVGCASHHAHVRDTDGRPLPTTALLDVDLAPARVHCAGRTYTIVEPPPPYLAGTHLATHEVVIKDAARLCLNIAAHDAAE